MDGSKSASRTGAGGRTVLRPGALNAHTNALEETPRVPGESGVLDYQAAWSKRGRRFGERRRESRTLLGIPKAVMAVAALGVLLTSLATYRYIDCFRAAMVDRLTSRRAVSGGVSRKLAGRKDEAELPLLVSVEGKLDSDSPSPVAHELNVAELDCVEMPFQEDIDEILVLLIPAAPTEDDPAHDATQAQRQQVPWLRQSIRAKVFHSLPFVLLLLATISGWSAVALGAKSLEAYPLLVVTYVFCALTVLASVVLSIESWRSSAPGEWAQGRNEGSSSEMSVYDTGLAWGGNDYSYDGYTRLLD